MNINKVRNGGLYLINLTGNVNPEFGDTHYCVLLHTSDKDLFLAFPTTTSPSRRDEKHTYTIMLDNSIVLFKHVRTISKKRIIGTKTVSGVLSVLDKNDLDSLLNEYKTYIDNTITRAISSNQVYHRNLAKSKNNLSLECVSSVDVFVGEEIDYTKLVINSYGGNITSTQISTKTPGNKEINIIIKDKYNQKITKKVRVNVLEKEETNI